MKITAKSQSTEKANTIVKASENTEAIRYIRCAIDALGAAAKAGDKSSKDAIANLGVVLFDIQK